MKALAFLKVSLKGIIKELPTFLLSYAVFPLIIALTMGYVQQDMFTPAINDPIFSIIIVDEDNTKASNDLVSFVNSEEISKILTVEVETNESFDYTLRIPKGYEDSLLGKAPSSVTVEAEEKSPASLGNILVNIVNQYNTDVSQGMIIGQSIKNNPREHNSEIINEINAILGNAYKTDSIKTNIYDVKKSLDSYEYYSITFISFIFVMFLMAVIMSDALEKEIGLYSRIMSTSMTRLEYLNYGILANYLSVVIFSTFYVGAYRVSGLSFKGSFHLLLLIILGQSLMITLLGTLIATIFKKKYGLPLIQFFLIYQVLFGGMMGPLDKWSTASIFKVLAKFKPDALISNSYRNYILYNNFSSISNYLLLMVAVSILLYLANVLTVKMKWGEVK